MKNIEIKIGEKVDIVEFAKSLSFVSDDIVDYSIDDSNQVKVVVSENADIEKIQSDLQSAIGKYKCNNAQPSILYEYREKKDFPADGKENSSIIAFGEGQIGFDKKGLFLLDYFDKYFSGIALEKGAIEKSYPVLLPVDDYSMTGYLKKSPQHALFCSAVNNNMDDLQKVDESVKNRVLVKHIREPYYALSPSACFHTYLEYKNKNLEENTLITFKQNVFRNEGRLNYKEKGRLCDYNVREIVMIGSEEYIQSMREYFLNKTAEFMEKYKLIGNISVASDSFVIPKMQIYRKIQRIDRSKYEMHLKMDKDADLSTASFNLHGSAFTDPFNIKVNNVNDTVTGCVGYGLHRLVLAFFAQYGNNVENWPDEIAEKYRLSC